MANQDKERFSELELIARKMRHEAIKAIGRAGGGHLGGVLSTIEILTVLYFAILRVDSKKPNWEKRDRFILSKGHGGPALYAVLAEKGFFSKEWLNELDVSGSRLPKHIDRLKIPGIEISTGPLGQGLSIGVGMALAEKLDFRNEYRIYVLLGDGECDSGQVWEAAMAGAKYQLDNLIAIIDRNGLQVDGFCCDVMPTEPLAAKWRAFGWHVIEVDGHDIAQILRAFHLTQKTKDKPAMIIAHTVKGKGVSFMENRKEWHARSISKEETEAALQEIMERES